MKKNIYQPTEAVIQEIKQETANIKTFTLKTDPEFSFCTGQFVELTVPGFGEAPFTPSSDPQIKGLLDVTIMRAGRVTERLHTLKVGDILGIRGPYGKGYPLDTFAGKDIVVVGGGVGLAPLRSLLLSLFSSIGNYRSVALRYGARTPQDVVYKELIPQWQQAHKINIVTTVDIGDPTWSGNVGLVTTILKDLSSEAAKAIAVVCGPPIMMKFVTLKLLDLGFDPQAIYLSMEKNMSCGLGKCGHCRVGRFYACKDGPVFTYGQLKDIPDIWD
jgi:sulfite reductase subunit B